MAKRRVGMDRLKELVRLHRKGSSGRDLARLLQMGPNTIARYKRALERAQLLEGEPEELPTVEQLREAVDRHEPPKPHPKQTSSVEPWRARIEALIGKGLGPRAIFDRLRLEDPDFVGRSESAVKRIFRRICKDRGVDPDTVAIPVVTKPGHIAQVDFGYAGRFYDPESGQLRRTWVFVMVLGHSRHMFARLVFDQRTETWLRLHMEAFAALGGVIDTVVPDNLKAAVVRAAFAVDDQSAINRSYRELARHYDFKIDPTPPYDPRKKGKVESGVKYVKRNALAGRQGEDVHAAQAELTRWVHEIAGTREHGTTGQPPLEVFEAEERATLSPLPAKRFELVVWTEPKVHPDSHVLFDKRLYSVPFELIGKRVWARGTKSTVEVYFDDRRVATHSRRGTGPRSTFDEHLPAHRVDYRHRSASFWEERASRMGPEVLQYVREIFASDEVLCQLRVVQSVVRHLENFPSERAQAACRRARHFGNYTYRGIKNILARALDLEPLPDESPVGSLEKPRFARSVGNLFPKKVEESDRDTNRRAGTAAEEAATLRGAPNAGAAHEAGSR